MKTPVGLVWLFIPHDVDRKSTLGKMKPEKHERCVRAGETTNAWPDAVCGNRARDCPEVKPRMQDAVCVV